MTNDLISAKYLMEAHMENQIRQYEWMVAKGWMKSLEQIKAEWAARPWHERARINAANWVRATRVKLGEMIAGREFNDDY
jgi:hypothetical protein